MILEKALDKASTLLEALPYIKEYYGKTVVIKFGGNAMQNQELKESFASDVVLMRYVGMNPVVVHGGGPQITDYMQKLSLPVNFVEGHRVTDAEAMEIVKMVLIGKINKEIVSLLNDHGNLSVGISGEDGLLLVAEKKLIQGEKGAIDLGFVGSVKKVNPLIVDNLLRDGFIPVVASIGVDEKGQSYNINADHVAGALAAALRADKLIFLTDIDGIYRDLQDPDSLISVMNIEEARSILVSGSLSEGMLPKLQGCIESLESGVKRAHIINGTIKHALLLEIYTQKGIGTMVVP